MTLPESENTTANPERLSTEVAHVLFLDIAGFSRLPMEEQASAVHLLREIVRQTPEYIRAKARTDLLGIDTGDGMALVFFRDPLAPLQCAVEITQRLQDHPGMALRMGIHTGPVSRVADLNGRENVTGSGINTAQRVMDCGDPGHILLSSATADMVREFETWSRCLHDLGEVEVKHGQRLHLYSLVVGNVGRSDRPSRLAERAAPISPSTTAVGNTTWLPDGGALPPDSPFYVVRPADTTFLTAIANRDSIVLVKGARQMGKTSLLARGLQEARAIGARVALADFQTFSAPLFASPDTLLLALAESLVDQLDLDISPREKWNPDLGANTNLERFLRRHILSAFPEPLLWGLDEVDRLFPPACDFGSEVFGLFRSWHNRRSLDPAGPWSRLTLAIAYATEAHLFITDMNQSPFNVGTRIALSDFDVAQLADLNRRFGEPLADEIALARFHALLGGQPYLSSRGLAEISRRGLTIDAFQAEADSDDGIFGDHLRRMAISLAQDKDLLDSIRALLAGEPLASPESFYRLRSAGLVAGQSASDAHFRCWLYESYLRRHLG